jgi:hypothetical protein
LAAIEASIACCRAMRCRHHSACSSFAACGQPSPASRGSCHSSYDTPSARLSRSRSGSSVSWNRSQITSISALLAIDFSVTCGTRS